MARISNTTAYSSIIPALSDYFVLTDSENNLNTKTCTLENLQTLYGLSETVITVAVSSTYLKVIAAQPYTLLAPPGDGYVYNVSGIVSFMLPGGEAFDFVNTLNITQGTITEALPLLLLTATTKKVYKSDPSPSEFIPENAGLILNGISSPTKGTGTLYINITYRKLKLDSTF
jgi:hypothetical protein